jgi:hypothetical protein
MVACVAGDAIAVQALLQDPRTDANAKADTDRTTPLMLAVMHGHEAVVRAMVCDPTVRATVPHVNSATRRGATALILACERGLHRIAFLLVCGRHVDPKADVRTGKNAPLMAAARGNHVECVRVLLAAGADRDDALRRLWGGAQKKHGRGRTTTGSADDETAGTAAAGTVTATAASRVELLLRHGHLCSHGACLRVHWHQPQQPPQQPQPSATDVAAAAAAAAAPPSGIPATALAGELPLKACGRCRRAEYCSPECAKRAWPDHKRDCAWYAGELR